MSPYIYWLSNVEEKTALLPRLLEAYTDTHSRLTAVFMDAAEGFKREPEFARIHFCYQFQEIGKQQRSLLENDFMAFLIAIIEAGQNAGELRQDICKTELAAQIMFNFTAVCLTWFSHPEQSDLDAFASHHRVFYQWRRSASPPLLTEDLRKTPVMANIFFTCFGSFGDLYPYLSLAKALEQREHRTVIASSSIYKQQIEAEGLTFAHIRSELDQYDHPDKVRDFLTCVFDPIKGGKFTLTLHKKLGSEAFRVVYKGRTEDFLD